MSEEFKATFQGLNHDWEQGREHTIELSIERKDYGRPVIALFASEDDTESSAYISLELSTAENLGRSLIALAEDASVQELG